MTKVRTWVGLDVHAATSVACVVDAPSGEISVRRLSGRTSEVAAVCAQLPAPARVAYEAAPTGFELARARAGDNRCCPYPRGAQRAVDDREGWAKPLELGRRDGLRTRRRRPLNIA